MTTSRRVPRRYRQRSLWRRWVQWWRRHLRPRWLRPRIDRYEVRLRWQLLLLRMETWWMYRSRGMRPPPRPPAPRADDVPTLSDKEFARLVAKVQRGIMLVEAGELEPPLSPDPQRRTVVKAFALIAVAMVAAGTFLALQVDVGGDGMADDGARPVEVEVEGAVTMLSLARTARGVPGGQVGEGEQLVLTIDYIPTEAQRRQGVTGQRQVQELTGDGRGSLHRSALPGEPELVGQASHDFHRPGSLKVGVLDPDEIAALPAEPEAIWTILQDAARLEVIPVSPYHVFELLATPVVPPSARAGLFHLLRSRGARVEGQATDLAGRPGITVVARGADEEQVVAIIDPDTTTVLSLERSGPEVSPEEPALVVYQNVEVLPDG